MKRTQWSIDDQIRSLKLVALARCALVALLGGVLVAILCLHGPVSAALASEPNGPSAGTGEFAGTASLGPELSGLNEAQAAEAARQSPEAFAARLASETRFTEETRQEAAATLVSSFPTFASKPAGGPPALPVGVTTAGFAAPTVEKLSIGGQYEGAFQSTLPIALETSQGAWQPVNLGLREEGSAFTPSSPLVAVRLPRQLSEGATLTALGLSLTPIDSAGNPLAGAEGVKDGAAVLFANTALDTDTVLKPTSLGLDASTVLRSALSPQTFYYRVGLPLGARLSATEGGAIAVVKEGVAVAELSPPRAVDAAGTEVPTTMTVGVGNIVSVIVDHQSGAFQYPILADPEFTDVWESEWKSTSSPWVFSTAGEYESEPSAVGISALHTLQWPAEDYAAWTLTAPGYTSVYEVYLKHLRVPETGNNTPSWLEAWMEIVNPGGSRDTAFMLSGSPYTPEHTLCVPGCSPEGIPTGNAGRFEVNTKESGGPASWEASAEISTALIETTGGTHHSDVAYNRVSPELPVGTPPYTTPNVLSAGNNWIGPYRGAFEFTATDGGLGVFESGVELSTAMGWKPLHHTSWLHTSGCSGDICLASEHEELIYSALTETKLPEGEDTIRVAAQSAMAASSSSEYGEGVTTLKVDAAPPHNVSFSGLATSGSELVLGEAAVHVQAEATDGEGATPSAGIGGITLWIDGSEIGTSAGACQPGPCTGAAQWTLRGSEIGTGQHTLEVRATDHAGNVATKTYTLNVGHATPVSTGPGTVDLESGAFALETTDVSLSGGLGGLAVTRNYNSGDLAGGESGALGPQWTVSLGSLAQLQVLPDQSVVLIGPEGITHFTNKAGLFQAPGGDRNLDLTFVSAYEGGGPAYLVTDPKQGTTTVFTLPKGASVWMPTASKSAIATDTMTDEYQTVELKPGDVIVQPTLELAPHPTAACVREKLERGCRALEFVYNETTTATGESQSTWGGYAHRLKEVTAVAYNPSTKAMAHTAVAAYLYDIQGRMRAEWNPSITPALKTIYGYDTAGRVTAMSSPGQQPWLMHYGTTASDPNSARLLSISRLSAEGGTGSLWNGQSLSNTTIPALSTTSPSIGTTLTVNTGTWSTTQVVYGYQWEDCNAASCSAIPGATNPSYTPQAKDAGYTLIARVTAYGAAGATTAASAASNSIAMPKPTAAATFGNTGSESEMLSAPGGVATDASGDVFVASKSNSRIEKFSPTGAFVTSFAPDSMYHPGGIAVSPVTGDMYISNGGNSHIDDITPTGTLLTSWGSKGTGLGQFTNPAQVAVDVHGDVWVANSGDHRVDEFSPAGTYLTTNATSTTLAPAPTLSAPTGVTECAEDIFVVDEARDVVDEYSLEGAYIAQYGVENHAGTGAGEFNQPSQIACEATGHDLYVADKNNNRIQELTVAGVFLGTFGTSGTGTGQLSGPGGVAVAPTGTIYVGDTANNRVSEWTPTYSTSNPAPPPPALGSNPTWTIEYNVPLSGAAPGLPQMTTSEVAKWGETDAPVDAGAIFPPDKPMAWPATEYARATIYYVDGAMQGVNVATAGGISTREYNAQHEVTRALNADNRATALLALSPVEDAELLDTKTNYNAEGALTDTWGPLHPVRLAHGKLGVSEEAEARNHAQYFYNEGAEAVEAVTGEKYGLLTKTIDGAETRSHESFDNRTTTTRYSGQNSLGWKLRKPTATTIDPEGLALTTSTTYEPETGNTLTSTTPAGIGKDVDIAPVPGQQYGAKGTGESSFEAPGGAAVDSHNDLWVADSGNNRLERFSSAGTFIEALGFGVSDGAEKFEICKSKCRAGIAGSGAGQFNRPLGVAAAPNEIEVADYGNGRIERFTEEGTYVSSLGSPGSGAGQLEGPTGVGIDSSGQTWVSEHGGNRLSEFGTGFIQAAGWGVSDGSSRFEQCTTTCHKGLPGSGVGQLNSPWGLAYEHETIYVADTGNARIATFTDIATPSITISGPAGELKEPLYVAGNALDAGILVTDAANNRVAEFSATGTLHYNFAAKGTEPAQLSKPTGIAVSAIGGNAVSIIDGGNDRVSIWQPSNRGNQGAHTTKTVYYTAAANKEAAACGGHSEWAGLPCETTPTEQPGPGSDPELPVSIVEYNFWDQPEVTTETFGTITRKRKTTFDSAGRPRTEEETSTRDQALPTTTDIYNTLNGSLEIATAGGKTIKSTYNTLGELETYTDAEGKKATYGYDIAGRVTSLSDPSEEGNGKQTYTYDPASGEIVKLEDSAAGTFGATYDASGRIATQSFPNGMTAYYTYSATGAATAVEYKKLTHCTEEHEKCVWFKDSVLPSIHGDVATQASTLSEEPSYNFDAAGRLTEVQEIPVGEGCKTRTYSYDEEGNRLSLTKRAPTAEGKCATEGGETSFHLYDSANHPIDEGVTYDAFGNATRLPEHAGEPELDTTFYVDGQTRSQTQAGETITYKLDPEDRTLETVSSGASAATVIYHYDGPGGGTTWTTEAEGAWTRNIPGIDGELVAVETSTKAPVLQIHDLRGNTVGTASLSETATQLESTYNSTEFGVPTTNAQPPKYAWLGAGGIASELASGTVNAEGTSYVPQTGRTLQSQPVALPIPSENAGAYAAFDPAWVGESAASAAALQNSEAWAAQHASETAPAAGVTPTPGCDEEVEACEPDPSHGANPWRCEGFPSWGHNPPAHSIIAYGHWRCHNGWPAAIEQELMLFWVGRGEEIFTEGKKKYWYYPNEVSSNWNTSFACQQGETYKLLAWTRTIDEFTKKTNWVGETKDGRTEICGNESAEIELPPDA